VIVAHLILSERLTIGLPQALVAVFCLLNKGNNVNKKGVVEFSKTSCFKPLSQFETQIKLSNGYEKGKPAGRRGRKAESPSKEAIIEPHT